MMIFGAVARAAVIRRLPRIEACREVEEEDLGREARSVTRRGRRPCIQADRPTVPPPRLLVVAAVEEDKDEDEASCRLLLGVGGAVKP